MGKFKDGMLKLKNILINSLKRFHETIFISTILVVVLIINNRTDWDYRDTLEHIALIAALGIPISASWVLIYERLGLRSMWRIIGGVSILAYGVISYLLKPVEIDDYYMIRYAFASAIFYFIFTLIPYYWNRRGYGKYCVRILTSFLTTYLYTIVLYLGVIAIIFTIDRLFNLNLSEEWYFDIFAISTGIFGLTYFLGQVPMVEDDLSTYQYPKILRVLLTVIVMPLLGLYTLVLYMYLIRIVVSVGWEDGFVSQLVIWYGFISLALMILVYPIKDHQKWVSKFYTYYPMSMIVPLIMLGISIGIRLNAYGLTVLRGMVFLALVWFVYGVVDHILFKSLKVQWIVIGFICIFSLAVFSPINVITMSVNQQIRRLETELMDLNMISEGRLVARDNLEEGNMRGISSILNFLDEYRGLDKVEFIPDGFVLGDMEEVFGFSYMNAYYYQDEFGRSYLNYYQDDLLVNIEGYEYHQPVTSRFNEQSQPTGDLFVIGKEDRLQVYIKGDLRFDETITNILASEGYDFDYMSGDDDKLIRVESQVDGGDIMMVFTNINGYEDNGQLVVDYYEVDVYISVD